MNKLPLQLQPNFQDAQLYKALAIAVMLYEEAEQPELKEIAAMSLDALITTWQDTSSPTEN